MNSFFPPGAVSANLTPDPAEHHRPEGHTFKEFAKMLRTGHDVEEDRILQVMPWPVFRNMTDEGLRAIYECLRAIPHKDAPPPDTWRRAGAVFRRAGAAGSCPAACRRPDAKAVKTAIILLLPASSAASTFDRDVRFAAPRDHRLCP
jgi:hypothetical protein